MSQITLDRQIVQKICEHCEQAFTVCRGSVYEDKEPIAIYLAAMHHCAASKIAHLAISIRKGYAELVENTAVMLRVKPTDTEFQMTFIGSNESPWQTETYLGKMLDRQQANASPLSATFFHIADHIVMQIPEVNKYLMEEAQ